MTIFKRKRLLCQQMELLAEKSKNTIPEMDDIYAKAMVELDKQISSFHPIGITILCGIGAYGLYCLLIKLK